jgi:hypothetical protein
MKLQLATCTIFRQLSDQVESTKLISDNCVGQIKNNVAMQYLVKIWCGLIKLKYRRFRISASCQCFHTNRNQSSPADSIPCFEANSCTGVWLEIVFWNIFPKSFKQLSITIYDLTLQNWDYSFYQRIPVNGKNHYYNYISVHCISKECL